MACVEVVRITILSGPSYGPKIIEDIIKRTAANSSSNDAETKEDYIAAKCIEEESYEY